MPIATATVATARPARYIKQLINHMGHKARAAVLGVDGVGVLTLSSGTVRLEPTATGIALRAEASDAELLGRAKETVTKHLLRFATQEELTVAWTDEA